MRYLAPLALALFLHATQASANESCAAAPTYQTPDPALSALLDGAQAALAGYPSLAQVLDGTGLEICLSSAPTDALGYFEPRSNRIVLDAETAPGLQMVVLFHELRHAEQAARGICPDLSLSMENYARTVWAMEADAVTISLIVAWGLREAGDDGPWAALVETERYADVVGTFSRVLLETQDVSAASQSAFEAWYSDDARRERYYIASCLAYLDLQEESHSLPRYGSIDPAFFADLCILPDGNAFPCTEPVVPAR